MSAQNIVVVGGGAAGVAVARELSAKLPKTGSQYNLILVTARECYVHMPAVLRMVVSSEYNLEETALVPYDTLFANGIGTVKVGNVTSVERNPSASGGKVVLEGGEMISFRFLVVATGSIWEGPLATLSSGKQELLASVKQWRNKFEESKSIAIAGGGSVGLELAGELRDLYPEKSITIVHASSLPLNNVYPDHWRQDVERRWSKRGIRFIFNDRIENFLDGDLNTIKTANGTEIKADLTVFARGAKPNTLFLRSLGDDVLDSREYVKVAPTLQLAQHPDVFAAGDIISFEEQKALAKAPGHAAVVVTNILSLVSGKQPKKTYTGTFEGVFITNGKNKGAGYVGMWWGLTFGDKVVPMLKGKNLFVSNQRKSMGLAA